MGREQIYQIKIIPFLFVDINLGQQKVFGEVGLSHQRQKGSFTYLLLFL